MKQTGGEPVPTVYAGLNVLGQQAHPVSPITLQYLFLLAIYTFKHAT